MTITELINMCLTHNISTDAEIYVNGNPAEEHLFYFKYTGLAETTTTCYKIDLMDKDCYDTTNKELKNYDNN